ncbi:MAG: DNA replication/repair protein RecF [Pseudomonadota bacterium]|nr:DNA replication/repair protein RecF [Pseudomonadota bacterium]
MNQNHQINYTKEEKSFDSIRSLKLTNFRSHENLSFLLSGKPLSIVGQNAVGKTNILEAISLLSPGRGLRNSSLNDLSNTKNMNGWGVKAKIISNNETIDISTGMREGSSGREVKINEKKVSGSSHLPKFFSLYWLTPSMDQIFLESPSYRRRFIDRLCSIYKHNHINHIRQYEKLMRERNQFLKSNIPDKKWLDKIEFQMARESIPIAINRIDLVDELNKLLDCSVDLVWPKASLKINGLVENLISSWNPEKAEKEVSIILRRNRRKDLLSKRTNEGIHRSDLEVFEKNKNIAAYKSSTGEQKGLLLSIIITHLELVSNKTSRYPVLLLDEVVAHLDEIRRASLFKKIFDSGAQVIMTGTDLTLFDEFKNILDIFILNMGTLKEV